MHIAELWRYPVKSMAGERLQTAHVTASGIIGDRVVQVQDARGRTITSRSHPDLLGHHATYGDDGLVLVDGIPWYDPKITAIAEKVVGPGAQLVHDESLDRFDVLPLLVATDGSIAAFGRDGRRLRPNIVIGGVAGLEERSWPGSKLVVGDVEIAVDSLRGRCNMTTFDPDTLDHDPGVLKDIVKRFNGKLALNCDILKGGIIQLNQEARLVRE